MPRIIRATLTVFIILFYQIYRLHILYAFPIEYFLSCRVLRRRYFIHFHCFNLHALCYVEVYDHDLIYHLSNGDTVTSRQSLSEIENILNKNKGFVKTHRSYIVNMKYIQKVEANCITMTNGDKIIVSRKNNILISDLFLKYRFE